MSLRVSVNPKIVSWAAARNNLSLGQLAQHLGESPNSVSRWLEGNAEPTLRQARNLAKKLHIPFGYLFLREPPLSSPPLPDFRSRSSDQRQYSVDLLAVLSDALRKRDWYRSVKVAQEGVALDFIGSHSLQDHPRDIASHMHLVLQTENLYASVSQWSAYVTTLSRHAESAGILVLRSGTVGNNTHRNLSPDEFQGFAIADEYAPLIFVNSNDTYAAQVFTLAHELAHLWLGASGVSNVQELEEQPGPDIEQVCNRVATEFLVPEDRFNELASGREVTFELAQEAARLFRVSGLVIARRFLELERIDFSRFLQLRDELQAAQTPRRSGSSGQFYTSLVARSSRRLVRELVYQVETGNTGYVEAAGLLGESVAVLERVIEQATSGQI